MSINTCTTDALMASTDAIAAAAAAALPAMREDDPAYVADEWQFLVRHRRTWRGMSPVTAAVRRQKVARLMAGGASFWEAVEEIERADCRAWGWFARVANHHCGDSRHPLVVYVDHEGNEIDPHSRHGRCYTCGRDDVASRGAACRCQAVQYLAKKRGQGTITYLPPL